MAGNTNTLSKKTIVAIVIAIVLLFVASLSVGIFLANRGDAEAAGGNQISDVNQTENNNQNTSSDNNQAPDQNTNIENNNTDSNNTENNNTENNNPETPNTDGNAGTVVDNNETTNNNTNNNGTVNNAENNTENRTNNNTAGVTTDANVNQVGETTVTRVEERERLVSRDYWDWWTPTSVAVASTATRLSPTTPDITVEKVATTGVGKNKFVYANKNITYTIKVTNNGEQELKNIEITDKIPEQTTFVSIDDAQNSGTTILENDTVIGLKWIVTVPAKESIEVKFTVKVNENATGTISNVAISNGTPSDTVETAIIESEKTATVEGKTEKTAVKGDTIHYAITVRNTGNVSGETLVKDADLKEILSNVAEMKGKVIVQDANGTREVTAEELIQGVKVQVNANSEATVTFDVTITSVNGAIKNVALIGESEIPTDPEIVDTEGVQVTKNVTSTDKDNDGKYDLNEIIEYEVEVKNIGSITLNNVVVNDDNSTEKTATIDTLAPGETKSVNFTHVVTEDDIKAGKVINKATVKDTPSNTVETPTENPKEAVELTKTVIGEDENKDGKYALGEIIHYEVSVKNIGNVTLSNVVVNDGNSTEKTATIDTLAPGETKSVEFTHKVVEADIKAGKVINKATVKDTPSNEVTTPTEEQKEAVEVTKKVTGEDKNKDGKYALGEIIHYEVSVKNTGNVTLKNVEVKDDNSEEKTATIDTLAPGETKSVNFTHVVTEDDIKAGKVINKATVKDTPSNTVETPTENPKEAVELTKTVIGEDENKDGKYALGEIIHYEVSVKNIGNVTLSNVVVNDGNSTEKTATIDTLAPGETKSVEFTHKVVEADIKAGKVINKATVKDTPSNEVTTPTEEQKEAVEVTKKVTGEDKNKDGKYALGEIIHYEVSVKNTGNVTLKNVEVKDDNSEEKTATIEDTLAPGETKTVEFTHKVVEADIKAGKVINKATAKDTPSNEVTTPTEEQKEAVEVTKKVTGEDKNKDGKYALGEIIHYEVSVKNTGNVTLKNVEVKDDNSEEKTATIEDTLAPGETKTVEFTHKVVEADIKAGKVINKATVKDTPSNEVTTPTEEQKEAVEVTKKVTGEDKNKDGKYALGEIIHYEVSVKNTGNVTLKNVEVKDDNSEEKTATIEDTLAPGETKTVEFTHKVVEDDIKAGKVINKATVKDTPSNEVTTPTEEQKEAVEVTKKVTGEDKNKDGKYALGEIIHYEVSVKNTGNVTLKNVEVKDDNSEEKTATIEDTLAPGETKTVEFTHKVVEADIKAGKVINKATVKDTPSNEVTTPTEEQKEAVEVTKKVTGEDKNKDGKYALGEIIHYEVSVKNTGNVTLKNVEVKDDNSEEKTATIEDTLAPGETKTVEFTHKVVEADIKAGEVINKATAKDTPSNEVTTDTEEPREAVELTKTVIGEDENKDGKYALGETIHYEVSVKNIGNVTLNNVEVKDGNSKEKTATIPTIEPGDTKSVNFTHVVTEDDIKAGEVINKATAKDTPSNEVTTDTEETREAVELTKTVIGEDENKDGKYALGETIHYEVSVKNIGNVTLNNVEVKDGNSKEKTATIPTIEPGDTKSVNFTHVVTEDDIKAGEVINKATAKDTPSNEVTTPTESANPSIDVQKTIVKVKDTEIPENTEVARKAQKEDKITYQIVATNNGNTTLSNVKITDDKNVTLESATLPERLADMTITPGNKISANTNLLGRNDITLQPGETITLTVSYTLQKADVLGSKDFVNKATATGKYEETELKSENSATIKTEFIPETGDKSVEKVWDDKNYESKRPGEITVQLMNGTTKVGDPVKLSKTNGWKHTWKELPLEDGNGKAITYTVKEDKVENYTTTYSKEQNGKFVITNSYNKPKAGGTITIHSTKSQEVNAPLDVVFILDTSGSMDNNSRATKAVTAINKAIAQVQGYNQYNRVGVVGFSGTYGEYDMWGNYYLTSKDETDSTELLKLKRYTAKTTSKDNVKQYLTINNKKINTNVNELATQNGRYVDGGTYTQIGIAEASKMLQKADKKVTIDGVEVTRTPVIILISDGEPTYYTESYTAVTSQNRGGTGSDTTADYGYYTILSANHYKQQVTTHYGRTAMMYTIGMGIKKQEEDKENKYLFARTVLNPDANNKNRCSQKGWNTKEKQLYDKIKNTSNYADGAYFGEMKEEQLTKILEQVIQASIPKERTEKITAEQIKNAKVELKDIDTTKEFSLKAGKTTYNTFAEAKTAGVIAGDETNGYYVDLTKVPAGSDLEISYHEK